MTDGGCQMWPFGATHSYTLPPSLVVYTRVVLKVSKSVWVLCLLAMAAVAGCRSAAAPEPFWDLDRAELVEWRTDVPSFQQDFALEASGLAASDRILYIASEKYARVLQMPLDAPERTRAIPIAVPVHSELEGVAWTADALYLCDEAHAAVYRVPLSGGGDVPEEDGASPLPAIQLPVVGPSLRPGKVGVEGIAVDPVSNRTWLLLERSGSPETGCVSTIYPLRRNGTTLVEDGAPVDVRLEDCNWRLTGLELWRGELLALKTQFPGERYEVVAVDQATGATRRMLEMTELLRSVRSQGWHNNVEGIAVTADGSLWLVSDNDWTGTIDDPEPGPAREKDAADADSPVPPPSRLNVARCTSSASAEHDGSGLMLRYLSARPEWSIIERFMQSPWACSIFHIKVGSLRTLPRKGPGTATCGRLDSEGSPWRTSRARSPPTPAAPSSESPRSPARTSTSACSAAPAPRSVRWSNRWE